ncbi:MAG: GNAT family N-acetyltransferase, partial [Coriobacteriales bacterium]|nr:GNAT family N-acetyltransferase [Coriobacteriales bacterium]
AYLPDEVKLYPCSLVRGTRLCGHYEDGSWQPYGEDVLLDILETDVLNTPAFVRISRMIRDISAHDIVAGNKKANLRQLVERRIAAGGGRIAEIRHREIRTDDADVEGLTLELLSHETTATSEHFLQWVTPTGRIAGFLRLSLPREDYVSQHQALLPIAPREAMIREVHIYGRVARLHRAAEGERGQGLELGRESERGEGTPTSGDAPCASASGEVSDASGGEGAPDEGAQHLGLGKRLIEAACDIARTHGYERLNVISSVGTREYYRALGFRDTPLYQQLDLAESSYGSLSHAGELLALP